MIRRKTALLVSAGAVIWSGVELAHAQSQDYQPVGGRVGSFIAYPGLELEEEYNDNIFKEDTGETDSFITRVRPMLSVESDWNRHSLNFETGVEAGFYSNGSEDDYLDYKAGLSGALDVTRGTEVYLSDFSYLHAHEERGADNVPGAAAEPWEYDRFGTRAGVRWKPNRLGVDVSGSYYMLDYDDLDLVGLPDLDGDFRDRDESDLGLKIGYDFSPGYFGYVAGRYFWRSYDETDALGRSQDSDGYFLGAGLAFEASPLITFDIAAGYRLEDYDDPSSGDVDGFAIDGVGTWYVTPLTTLGLSLSSDVEETTALGASGKLVNSAELTVDHELLRNLVLDGSVGYTRTDYQGGSLDRQDDDFSMGLGATYWMNRNLYAGASYRFSDRSSDAAGQDYTQNVFLITLGAQF